MAKFIIYKDYKGEYRWRFLASNGRIIADSGEGYINRLDCERAINFLKVYGVGATVQYSHSSASI